MNPDQKLIQAAYEDAIKGLYVRLFDGFVQAASESEPGRQAEQNFTAGVALARKARDRAIALLA
jgi:hypothetical protein